MEKLVYFITHPNVAIDPDTPVPRWPLSELGFSRMRTFLKQRFVQQISAIYCSDEQKAIDGADVLANDRSLQIHQLADLGENDRSSTGYLPSEEFERVADQFFASPDISVRGWETAQAAQNRIYNAVMQIINEDDSQGDIAIVSHGGVGSLLLCRLANFEIDREHDQPGSAGGNYFTFKAGTLELVHGWKPIDPLALP